MNSKQMSRLELIEEALRLKSGATDVRVGGRFSSAGALVVETGKHTGRAIKEKFIVKTATTSQTIDWNKANQPLDEATASTFFNALKKNLENSATYTTHKFVGPFPIQVTSTSPWHIAFADNMFRSTPASGLQSNKLSGLKFEVFHSPFLKPAELDASLKGKVPEEALILIDFDNNRVGICGTAYAGEIKKSAFSMCNYRLPEIGHFPMHSGANTLADGSGSCVLFGLSGTGKTSLSAAADRALVGDDEIIWTDDGLWNLEGGCYAKLIDLHPSKEPEIFSAVNRFGAIMENVVMDPATRVVDFTSKSKTENTRGSYPLELLDRVFRQDAPAQAPKTVVFLTADAFGAMPAVAKLDTYQAQYHFLSGYTAKVAGTEMGVKEPSATFSACFGAAFMPRHPATYAKLLAEKVQKNGSTVWLLNTGWFGGGYGVGQRFPIAISRRILQAIQSGELDRAPMTKHPIFGFSVPTQIQGVEPGYLKIPAGPAVESLAEKFKANMNTLAQFVDKDVIERGGPLASATSMSRNPEANA